MNLGSRLNRVKQQASIFLRGDKTDVIGTLRDAEDKTDELRILSEAVSRSLEKRLYTYNVTDEKKLSKLPETQAAELMKEGLKEVISCQPVDQTEKSLYRGVIEEAVTTEKFLGNILLDYEEQVEREVLPFLHNLLKDEFPSLSKQKKTLKQAGQDLDAAKARLRNSMASNAGPAKVDGQKYDLDEAESKLEQIKDNYACDLFKTLSHQREVTRLTCLQLQLKLEFFQRSVVSLNLMLPTINNLLEESHCGPVYSIALQEHLKITGRKIALPIEVCVKRLIEVGLKEEGLFRVAGSSTKIKRLRSSFDAGLFCDGLSASGKEEYDVHVVAGALKLYLRELPEPMLSYAKHDRWTEASSISDHDERLRALWQEVNSLHEPNHRNLMYIMKFLSMIAHNSSYNKMTANNIAIVIAPNLIWTKREAVDSQLSTLGRNMTLTNDYRIVVEQMIDYCNYFFKEDIDFGVQPISMESDHEGDQNSATAHNANIPKVHKRNNSSDFEYIGGHDESDFESPKHPYRNKKKQAPKPPALKKVDLKAAESNPESSPSLRRSHSPPVTVASQGKSQYIRRPTVEPPLPPVQAVNRPPRPQPPSNYETGMEQKSNIAGEDVVKNPDTCSNSVDVHENRNSEPIVSCERRIGDFDLGVSLRDSAASSSEFRKSLESVLKHPQPLPRHLTRMSTSYPESGDSKLGLPVAAQRSFRRIHMEPIMADKPIIPEKPVTVIQRPAVGAENSRPLVPEKPSILSNKLQVKSASDEEATAPSKNVVNSTNATQL